jgi:hypothetical protein
MIDPIEISRWYWDGRGGIHSGARHVVADHGHYRTYNYASARGLENAVLGAKQ